MKKKLGKDYGLMRPIAVGCCASILTGFVVLGGEATLVSNGMIPLKDHSFVIYILQFLVAFVGTTISCLLTKKQKLIAIIAVLAVNLFLLFSITIMFYGGKFRNILPSLLALFLGGGSTTLIQMHQKDTSKIPKKFRTYR